MTEAVEVRPTEKGQYETRIECVLFASYFMLMEQHLHIELWSHEGRFTLNKFIGYDSLRLVDAADGKMEYKLEIYENMEKDPPNKATQQRATIEFKFLFEEVWDYRLKFIDWRTNSLTNIREPNKDIVPLLKI